jgi:hypothetical protein
MSPLSEARQAGLLECPFGLLGPAPASELVPHGLPIMAIDDGRQMCPAVGAAVDMREIGRPPLVAARGLARASLPPGAGRHGALVHEPALQLGHGQPMLPGRLLDGRLPFKMLRTRATRRFAVHRWTSSGGWLAITRPPPSVVESRRVGGLTSRGARWMG